MRLNCPRSNIAALATRSRNFHDSLVQVDSVQAWKVQCTFHACTWEGRRASPASPPKNGDFEEYTALLPRIGQND